MSVYDILLAILGCAVVTWLARVLPFVLVNYRSLPDKLLQFLQYLPISIIFALLVSSLFETRVGQLPSVRWLEWLAMIPTVFVAFRYKNILLTVLVGIVSMAALRFFL